MLALSPFGTRGRSTRAPSLLFIGAHSDDIEIGCGATVVELLRAYPRAKVHWVVLSAIGEREREARRAATMLLGRRTNVRLWLGQFRNAYFPSEFPALKDHFEKLKAAIRPDIVFTHDREDLHQDHRTVGELTWNTFRSHLILEYEIPKYDGGLRQPSFFVPVSSAAMNRKVRVLERCFSSQRNKQWFSADTFRGLMRLRGVECNAPGGHAEAFHCRKAVLGLPRRRR